MGLFDWIKSQFIDIIEWLDESGDTIVYRFDRYDNEIKYGAKLIVRPSQVAVFVSEGEIADVLEPGTYELETKNLPILTDLQHWDHGFSSPFKAEIYFVSTKRFTNLKWGTRHPIIIDDVRFGPVRIRAFGTFEIRVVDPVKFIKEIVGTDGYFTTDEIKDQLANLIVTKLPQVVANSGISIIELAKHYDSLSEKIRELLEPYFEEYGLKLEKLLIENLSLPKEVEKALDERSSMSVLGDMQEYLRYKSAEGVAKGGSASDMVGLGAGIYAAREAFKTPPPLPKEQYFIAKNNKPQGPYDKDMLMKLIKDGQLRPETLVWQEGMSDWQEAKDVVNDLFKKVPPKLDENRD